MTDRQQPSLKVILGHALEMVIVLSLGFGLFILSSTYSALSARETTADYNDMEFYSMVIYEVLTLTIIFFYLRYRKWKLKDLRLSFDPGMLPTALLLVVTRVAIGFMLSRLIYAVFPSTKENLFDPQFHAGLLSVVLVIVVNSVYEEVLLIGYIFKRLEHTSPLIPFFLSLLIRLSYHTYQGWANIPMIFSMALVFGIYYMGYKKLWPLILAHAISNTFSFLNLHYQWFEIKP